MNNILPSHFQVNIPFIILFVLAILAAVYTYYYYRKTIPPVSNKIRILLSLLRGLAVFLILSLFFSPQLKLTWQQETKPEIVIAIDKSASMKIADNNQPRFNEAQQISDYIFDEFKNTNQIYNYYFDIDTVSQNDSIKVGNLGTNINLSLNNLLTKHKNSEATILISDGIITKGSNPLFSNILKTRKIHTVGIGDTSEAPDVFVKNVITNKMVYKNNSTKIKAELVTNNLNNFKSTVKLVSNNKIFAAKNIHINKSGEIYPVEFEIVPKNTGNINYQVIIDGFDNEKFKENNEYAFQIEVLKDKLNVGLLADKPGFDLKFIKQIIQSDKNFRLSTFIELNRYSDNQLLMKSIDSSDVLITIDLPGRTSKNAITTKLTNLVESKRIPVCYFALTVPSKDYRNLIQKRFPDLNYTISNAFSEEFILPTISGNLNPVFNIFDNSQLNNNFWQNTAPIEYYFRKIQTGKTDKLLLQVRENPDRPVLISNTHKGLNNLLFLGNGFWRWKFLMAEDRQFAAAYETFFINLIKWIVKNPDKENINIQVNKKGLPLGEQLTINIQLYDPSFNTIDDGDVKLMITGPGGEFEAAATNAGNGNYLWQYTPLTEGAYKIEVTGYKNDVFLGSNEIEFSVLPVNNEFIFTKQDAEFLKKLASTTGGRYFTTQTYKNILPLLPTTPKIIEITENYDLWNKMYTLLIIIFLLSVEWFIRKRKDLA